MDELEAWLILSRAPAMHAGALTSLVETFGSVEAVVSAQASALSSAGVSAGNIAAITNPDREQLAFDITWLEQAGHAFIPFDDARYPPLVAQLHDAPIGLFVRGDTDVLSTPQLAIVGSRNP